MAAPAPAAPWFLYPPPSGEEDRLPVVGEPVFVWLRSDRDTGRARVAAPPDPSDPDRRLLVSFDCDPSGALTHRTRPARLLPVFAPGPAAAEGGGAAGGGGDCGSSSSGAAARAAVVCASTDTYRRLARSQLTKADSVLEIGCSTGGATALLARHAGRVVGVDNSQWMVKEARARNPGVRFEVVDALASPDEVASLGAGATAVFVDIGGNRSLGPLVTLLPWVEAALAPRLLVVKCEALAAAAGAWLAEERAQGEVGDAPLAAAAAAAAADVAAAEVPEPSSSGGNGGEALVPAEPGPSATAGGGSGAAATQQRHRRRPGQIRDAAAFWAELRARTAAGPLAANPLFYKARAKEFKGTHPMKFPERLAPSGGGRFICRPHNYATCHAGEGCAYDHATCHHCLEEGHRALECTK